MHKCFLPSAACLTAGASYKVSQTHHSSHLILSPPAAPTALGTGPLLSALVASLLTESPPTLTCFQAMVLLLPQCPPGCLFLTPQVSSQSPSHPQRSSRDAPSPPLPPVTLSPSTLFISSTYLPTVCNRPLLTFSSLSSTSLQNTSSRGTCLSWSPPYPQFHVEQAIHEHGLNQRTRSEPMCRPLRGEEAVSRTL